MEREKGEEEKEEKGWDEGWEWRRKMIKGWKRRERMGREEDDSDD